MRKHIMLNTRQVLAFASRLNTDVEMTYHKDGRKQRLWIGYDASCNEVYVATEYTRRVRPTRPDVFLRKFPLQSGTWTIDLNDVASEFYSRV